MSRTTRGSLGVAPQSHSIGHKALDLFVPKTELVYNVLTPLEPQSRFGDKLLEIKLVCPQNGTAVLKGWSVLYFNDFPKIRNYIDFFTGKAAKLHPPKKSRLEVCTKVFLAFLGFLGTRIGQLRRASRATPHEQTRLARVAPKDLHRPWPTAGSAKYPWGSLLRVDEGAPTKNTEATG